MLIKSGNTKRHIIMEITGDFISIFIILFTVCVSSKACPDVTSCECRIWTHGNSLSYNVVECEGEVDVESLNLSSYDNGNIRKFTFTNTTFSIFDSTTFKGLQVDAIKIQNQKMTISEDAFVPLETTLKDLSLINVNIRKRWKLDFLKNLYNLESLTLDGNGVFPEHFPENVFRTLNLTGLKRLSLRFCKIANMPDMALEGLTNLEELDLSHNFLHMVPNAILKLKKLRKLNISNNERFIYVHDYAFKRLIHLEEIDMSHTNLSTISEYAFYDLENSLTTLKLHHSQLVDGHFASMKDLRKLKYLDVSYNRIVEMHNTSFDGFIALEELDISGQQELRQKLIYRLGFIDSIFKGIERKLKILRIRDLGMSSLPLAALKSLRKLRILDASKNDFTEVYESFFYGIKAKIIYMTDMQITEVSHEAFETLPPGVEIYFDRNNITNISFVLETQKCLFHKLSLAENPITCGCDVIEIAATHRVNQLIGTCADYLYEGENIKSVFTLDMAIKNCDMTDYRNDTYCSYINSSVKHTPKLQLVALVLLLIVFFSIYDTF
ncbi:Leucine rich repeat C-terminal domain [Mactra antiquata]